MEQTYFLLNHVEYEITDAHVVLDETEDGIRLFPEINAENHTIEPELSALCLYHNNGLQTGVKQIKDLVGKKFIWNSAENENGEEAGNLYVLEHEAVTEGTIEILDVNRNVLTLKWTGKANVFWNESFGADVPFETVVSVKLPKKRRITIDAYKSVTTRVNKDLAIELLNFQEVETAAKHMQEQQAWTDFNVTLHFKVIYQGTEYLGKVKYTNGKNHYATYLDEACPLHVTQNGFGWSETLHYFRFEFVVKT